MLAARETIEQVTRLQPSPVDVGEVRDQLLPGAAGRLPARVYAPAGEGEGPLVLYLHGGGWALGSIAAAVVPAVLGPVSAAAARSRCPGERYDVGGAAARILVDGRGAAKSERGDRSDRRRAASAGRR